MHASQRRGLLLYYVARSVVCVCIVVGTPVSHINIYGPNNHVLHGATCRLTAKNPTLSNRVWATFTFLHRGTNWRHLVITIDPYVCSSDAHIPHNARHV